MKTYDSTSALLREHDHTQQFLEEMSNPVRELGTHSSTHKPEWDEMY